MDSLNMELREVTISERTIVGVVMPYDEVTYLVADPGGEMVKRGAFAKSIAQRGGKVPLLKAHGRELRYGTSRTWEEADGLIGSFGVNDGAEGDRLLEEARDGYYGGMSVGMRPLQAHRDPAGVKVITEAALVEVSLVGVGAYAGAGLLEVRAADEVAADLEAMLAPFRNPPAVNLAPLPPVGYRSR